MNNTCSIILAAGEGTRMKSDKPKVLSEVLFKPMISWVIDSIEESEIKDICIIAGFKQEMLTNYLKSEGKNIQKALQQERKGTAHAVMMAKNFLEGNHGKDILILNGDAPFIDSATIKNSYQSHKDNNNAATVISAVISEPFGYGRIVRNKQGELVSITEQKDASDEIQKINEVNSGAYWFNVDHLLKVLYQIKSDNAQNEYYLPDAIKILINEGLKVGSYISESENVILGANDCWQLNKLNDIARKEKLKELMLNGVNIPCTDGIIISKECKIGKGVQILPNTIIKGKSIIEDYCILGPNTYIENSVVEEGNQLNSVCCINKKVYKGSTIFPFSCI